MKKILLKGLLLSMTFLQLNAGSCPEQANKDTFWYVDYYNNGWNNTTKGIYKVDISKQTGGELTYSVPNDMYGDIAVSPDGYIYVASMQSNEIIKFSTDGKTRLSSLGSLNVGHAPNGLTFDENGYLYVGYSKGAYYRVKDLNSMNSYSVWFKPRDIFSGSNVGSSGDVIFANKKAYVSITDNDWTDYLIELTLDANNDITANKIVGKLPSASYGLSTDGFGRLFVSSKKGIYELDVSNSNAFGATYTIAKTLTTTVTAANLGIAGLASRNESLGNACEEPSLPLTPATLLSDYHFDACEYGDNRTVIDHEGNNDATIIGNKTRVASITSDVINRAITLEGASRSSDPRIDINVDVDVTDGEDTTVSIWTKLKKPANTGYALLSWGEGMDAYRLMFSGSSGNGGDIDEFTYADTDAIKNDYFGFNTSQGDFYGFHYDKISDDVWHHIVAVFHNGDETKCKIYLDGEEEVLSLVHADNRPEVSRMKVATALHLGGAKFDDSTFYPYNGNIDEVKVYKGELSSTEVKEIYQNEKAHKNADATTREAVVCGVPFNCLDNDMYFSNRTKVGIGESNASTMWLHTINKDQSPFKFDFVGENPYPKTYNALAYNLKDNLLYAVYTNMLLQIDSKGDVREVGELEWLPQTQSDGENRQHYSGTFDKDGYYYLGDWKDRAKIHKIDIQTLELVETITMQYQANFIDITMADNYIYFMHRSHDKNTLQRLSLTDKVNGKYRLDDIGDEYENETEVDAIFYDANHKLYVLFHEGGFFEIDTTTGERIPISSAPKLAGLNDGAICPNATLKFNPTITIGDASVNEGGHLVFPVTLYNVTNERRGYTFSYQAFDGNDSNSFLNATIAKDFEALTHPTTIVNELPVDTTITIPTIQDTEVEADESLHLVLTNLSRVLSYQTPIAKGTIIDNDRPQGVCYATTDNYDKLFIYDDLDETDGLASPSVVDLNGTLRGGEGGGYRALDGYMYIFYDVEYDNRWDLKRIDTKTGEITTAKEGILTGENLHIDAAEFFYDKENTTDILYVTDKHEKKFYIINTSDWSITKEKDIIGSEGQVVKIGALAIDPYSGKFYATQDFGGLTGKEDENPILFSLDISGDTVVASKLFDLPHVDAEGLAFSNDGKLYLETEEVGSGDAEHKIYRVNLTTQTLTKVAHTGTKDLEAINKDENSYVDIETLSCDGGVYQAPPIFTIEQKEITIDEGNDNPLNGTNGQDINITITANKYLSEDIEFTMNQSDGNATQDEDYKLFSLNTFSMIKGENSVTFHQPSVIADTKVEHNENFICEVTLAEEEGKFYDSENLITVNIIDDDYNSFTGFDIDTDVNNQNIKTKIVGKAFTLTLAKVKDATHVADTTDDTNTTKVRIIPASKCDEPFDMDKSIDFELETSDELKNTINHPFTLAELDTMGLNNSAIKEAKLQFYWINSKNEVKTECSSDSFSIRPKKYNLSINSPIVAGEDFNLTIKAVADDNTTVVTNYQNENASVYGFDANDTNASTGCSFGKFKDNPPMGSFTNGEANIILNYNDVGNLKFKVYENNNTNTEFANIDKDDSGDSRFIGSAEITKSISAAKFTATFSYKTKNGKNYTYYSQNPNIMGTIIDINISVQNKDNGIVKNFKKGCYAKDVNIALDYSQLGDTSVINTVASFVDDNTTYPSGASIAASKLTLNIDKRYFKDGNASKKVYMNFGRSLSSVKLPLKTSFTKETSKISGLPDVVNSIDKNISFIYARAHVQNEIEVVGKTLDVPIKYEVYLPTGIVGSDYSLPVSLPKSVDDRRWSVLPADGVHLDVDSVALKYPKTGVSLTHSSTNINVTVEKTPHKNRANYTAKEYLKTDTDSFIMSLLSPENTWSGKGKEGQIFDDSASKKTIKRLNW